MIYTDEDKKLVDQYKQTNVALRRQLNNLNDQIDRILAKKSGTIGLNKLPSVSKHLNDPATMQQQIQNSKKRLECLQRDAELMRNKSAINYYQEIKRLENEMEEKEAEMQRCQRQIRQYERKDKIADVQATRQTRTDKKVSKLQEEISRYQRMERDLIKEISAQTANEHKNANYMQELMAKHAEIQKKQQSKKNVQQDTVIKLQPVQNQSKIGEEEWSDLKKQFLTFKETKQSEQNALNQENQRLRAEIKQWEKKIKDKKKRIESVNDKFSKQRQSRVYSTLNPNESEPRAYRYRDRNNSVQYATKQ